VMEFPAVWTAIGPVVQSPRVDPIHCTGNPSAQNMICISKEVFRGQRLKIRQRRVELR
jgi:hypothetical protein